MKKFAGLLSIMVLITLVSVSANANAGWPGLWVIATAGGAFSKFWMLICLSLIIEWLLLRKYSQLTYSKSVLATVLANAVSTLVGIGLGFLLIYSDALLDKLNFSGAMTFSFDLAIIFIVSVTIEASIVLFFWKADWKKIAMIVCISNLVTHALSVFYMLTTSR